MPTHSSNDSVFGGFNIFLQSKDAIKDKTHKNAHCDFFLDKIIQPERGDIGMLVSCIDAEIPFSFYNVSQSLGNTTLTVNNEYFELDDRNYNAFNVEDSFNAKFAASNSCVGISMTFGDTTNKFTFTTSNVDGNGALVPFTINSTTMVKELGITDAPTPAVTSYTSAACANLSGTSSIYIESTNMLLNNVNSFGKTFNVLSKVLVDTSPSSFIFYQPNQPQYFMLNNTLNYVNIQLKNDDGQFINFNNVEWSLTLSIEFYRKRDDIINTKFLMDYPVYNKTEEPPPTKNKKPPKDDQ